MRCYRKWHHTTGSNVTRCDVSHETGSMFCACATGSRAFFLLYSSAKCTIAHDRHGYRKWRDRRSHDPEVVPLEGCAHLQPEVAHYPPLVGPFPLENIRARMRDRKCPRVVSRTLASYYPFPALSLIICPFPAILFSSRAPSIITFLTKVCCFRICCVVLQAVQGVSAFSLWYF